MPIYRSDQATVTFAPEVAQGGYLESATMASVTNATLTDTTWGHLEVNAGDKTVSIVESDDITTAQNFTLTANSRTGVNLQVFIMIGNNGLAGQTNTGPKEIRRIVSGYGTSTLTVDTPFGFHHPATTNAGAAEDSVFAIHAAVDGTADSVTSNDAGKYITWFPGVYESVDCPDPEQAFEPRYVLGGLTNRNFYQMYAGNETLAGSIGGMVMLNGFPLRFPIGKVVTTPVSSTTDSVWNPTAATKAGDVYIPITRSTSGAGFTAGNYVMFGVTATTYTGTSTHVTDSTAVYEIRKIVATVGTGTTGVLQVWPPLSFAHTAAENIQAVAVTLGTTEFLHTIFEQVALTPLTWNVNIVDDTGSNAWQRRYVGGKVGSMTLSAEAGGLLTGGWDGVNFLDMVHNMKAHPDLPANQPLPRYTVMQNIIATKVGKYNSSGTFDRPATAPYYYSQGSIKMFGVTSTTEAELARIASFNLSISNNAEPKYYVGAQYDGRRAPKEQFEGNREYTMSASIATNDSADQGTDDTRNLFKELLLAGDYRGTTTATGFRGFGIQLKFVRDIDGSGNDYIQFDIPGDGTAAAGGNEQGAFIRAAPHNIGEDSPILADADIAFRSLRIKIRDTEPIYP